MHLAMQKVRAAQAWRRHEEIENALVCGEEKMPLSLVVLATGAWTVPSFPDPELGLNARLLATGCAPPPRTCCTTCN